MRAILRRLILIIAFCLICAPAAAPASPRPTPNPCSILAEPMRQQHVPGLAIAVFQYGQPTLYYCGEANTSTRQPITRDTVFQAASLSKPVFAYAVLQLVREHKLDLDKPLTQYLNRPYLHRQHPFSANSPTDIVNDPQLGKVTARMVLSHTSGMPNWARGPLKFQSEPGKRWSYSSEAYVYLQLVVESISGQPLEDFVRSNVFLPLQMLHSAFTPAEISPELLAQGYDRAGRPVHNPNTQPLASSTLFTTLDDYSRFLESLLILPQEDSPFSLMQQPQSVASASAHLTWGLGVGLEDSHNKRSILHWGANPGFRSFFLLSTETGNGVLYLTNSDNGLALLDTIVALYAPGRHPVLRFPMLHPTD